MIVLYSRKDYSSAGVSPPPLTSIRVILNLVDTDVQYFYDSLLGLCLLHNNYSLYTYLSR